MNIDELTLGQIKEINALNIANSGNVESPFVGKYVLCRCYSAGIHTGILVSQKGDMVVLKNSRRLYYWKSKSGIALSGVAQNGLDLGSKIDTLNPEIMLTGVIEIIPCSKISEESINGY